RYGSSRAPDGHWTGTEDVEVRKRNGVDSALNRAVHALPAPVLAPTGWPAGPGPGGDSTTTALLGPHSGTVREQRAPVRASPRTLGCLEIEKTGQAPQLLGTKPGRLDSCAVTPKLLTKRANRFRQRNRPFVRSAWSVVLIRPQLDEPKAA